LNYVPWIGSSEGSGRILGLERGAADVTIDPELLRRGLEKCERSSH